MKKILALSFLISTTLLASLQTEAKQAGLAPIPSATKALNKLINNPKNPLTKDKVRLGNILFFDPRLSKSGIISCNTCHNLGLGGTDGISAAIGHKWTSNPHHLNSPTVYNAVFNTVQMWDGRFKDLEEQAGGPVQAEPEMAAPKALVEKRLNSIPSYVKAFKKVFGKVSFENMQKAIAAFERTLVTPSAYDKFLQGNKKSLSTQAQKGLKTFIDKGCVSCHTGVGLGGTMQAFPVAGKFKYANIGDFQGDANHMVKVPTLRNITQTAPYFHNGTVWNLEEAVAIMAEVQLGMTLKKNEIQDIVAFLRSLNGKTPKFFYPQLPASTLATPQPDAN